MTAEFHQSHIYVRSNEAFMRDVPFEADNLAIFLHNDDATPWDFVVSLLQAVFGLTEANAESLAAAVN